MSERMKYYTDLIEHIGTDPLIELETSYYLFDGIRDAAFEDKDLTFCEYGDLFDIIKNLKKDLQRLNKGL